MILLKCGLGKELMEEKVEAGARRVRSISTMGQHTEIKTVPGISPMEPAGQTRERETERVGRASRSDFALDQKAELFAKEQIFGGNRGGGSKREADKYRNPSFIESR